MATVVQSTFVAGPKQADGRYWVTETHTFDVAPPAPMVSPSTITYLAGTKDSVPALISGHAADLNTQAAALAKQVAILGPTLLANVQSAVAALAPADLVTVAQQLQVPTFTVTNGQQAQVGV